MLAAKFTDSHRETVCQPGNGSVSCRYLVIGTDGWGCVKHSYPVRWELDSRAEAGNMKAVGDNCEGVFAPVPAYRLLADACGHPAGTICYEFRRHDYGLASDDTRATGIPHRSVTLDPAGGYPSFTAPERALEALEAERV